MQHLISTWKERIYNREQQNPAWKLVSFTLKVVNPNLHVMFMKFFKAEWALRNRFTHKVTLIGTYTDCVLHFRAQRLWGDSRRERQRNIAASIRSWTKEENVQEQRERGLSVERLPRTFKRAVKGGWSMKDPGKTCTPVCVGVCVRKKVWMRVEHQCMK